MAEQDDPTRVLAEANERAVAAARGASRKRPRLRWRRLWPRRRSGLTRHGMLPLLIKVFAGFSQVDGQIEEREIDVALGSLRHDFPETVYSELRELYRQALRQPQDLNGIARSLQTRLAIEDKILLGVQLYAMVSRSELDRKNLTAFYQFMTNLGVADEAMDIVYQLNTSEPGAIAGPSASGAPGHHLETLVVSRGPGGDVVLPGLEAGHAIIAFRLGDLILLKNIGALQVITRGRTVQPNGFVRLFDGQQVVLGEMVLDYRDLSFYFNAKKQVASVRLYLSFDSEGNAYVEKQQSRQTFLEVWFGLSVTITAFRDTPGSINGLRLLEGATLEASLRDRIEFDDRTEIALLDLWRRAKVLGGRFDLNPARSEYLVSNNPSDLQEGDILVSGSQGGQLLLRIRCDHDNRTGELEVIRSDRPVLIGETPVRGRILLRDGDAITIGDGQFLRCHFTEGIIEEERNLVSRLQVREVSHRYGGDAALDAVSFAVERGEMVCIMGPSGSGKSTLLRALAGHLKPSRGQILLNGVSMYGSVWNRQRLAPYVSFIPHEEAIEPLLTVEENIDLAATIRAPYLRDADRKRRADAKLTELGLSEVRHQRAGDSEVKMLSSGQRKRLNAGLDMIGISDVYLFDEPTSGLSSKDSEHVLELIRGLAHNKIVIVSIHQPSARLFQLFHKALLLDHGGKVAFFGTPRQTLDYFRRVQREEQMTDAPVPWGDDAGWGQPDLIFDILETPLRDLNGEVIYEEDKRGQLSPSRRFSPAFWQDRFQTHRLMEEVHRDEPESDPQPVKPPPFPARTWRDEWVQFGALLKRAFLGRLRNRSNLTTTLLEAPALALLVSFVLRYAEGGTYRFHSAFHLPTYFFLTLVIGMFLGLTNSVDEVLRDRTILQRERNHRVRVGHYVIAKIITLGFFALLQCIIHTLVGSWVLGIRDMFLPNLFWMYATTVQGVITGLLISSLVPNPKTALNCIPLILIPQIILGGALIKYEEMNRDVKVEEAFRRIVDRQAGPQGEPSHLSVPAICSLMPLRWSYEGMILCIARFNPVSRLQTDFDHAARVLAARPDLDPEGERRLRAIKDARPYLQGLEARSPLAVQAGLKHLEQTLRTGNLDRAFLASLAPLRDCEVFRPQDLYVNQKIQDLYTRAEMERLDYRSGTAANVFFGARRTYRFTWPPGAPPREIVVSTLALDVAMLGFFALAGTVLVYLGVSAMLRRV